MNVDIAALARGREGQGHRVRLADRDPRDRAAHRLPAHPGPRRHTPASRSTGRPVRSGCCAQELADDGRASCREWDDTPEDFGRIAATTARQVILQRLRDVENERTFGDFAGREHDLITGTVSARREGERARRGRGAAWVTSRASSRRPSRRRGRRYTHGAAAALLRGRRRPAARGDRRSPCPAPTRTWCASCSRWRSRRSRTASVEITAVAREAGHRSKIAVRPTVPG